MLKIAMYTGYRITSRKEKNTMYHCSYGARYANFLITYSSNRDEKIKNDDNFFEGLKSAGLVDKL